MKISFHSYEDNSDNDEVLVQMHFTDFVKRFCDFQKIANLDSWRKNYLITNYGSPSDLLVGEEFCEWLASDPHHLLHRIAQAITNTIYKQNALVKGELSCGVLPGSLSNKTSRIFDVIQDTRIEWHMSKTNATYFRLKFVD